MRILSTRDTPMRPGAGSASRVLLGLIAGLALGAAATGQARAASLPYLSDAPYSMTRYASLPVTSVDSATPQAMIQLSKDHQLFFKAYNDYTDLDRDGELETTYDHGFDYYGYFDSYKCYVYSALDKRFQPVTANDQVTTEASDSAGNLTAKYCGGADQWSGNFLNWASMTRVDVVRKILIGGKRSTDESTLTSGANLTVLERSFLPTDAHSFAKYYLGSDIRQLTPFDPPADDDDERKNGITLCNTTVSSISSALSQNVTDPPLIRVAKGNFSLWSANERWQCRWHDELFPSDTDLNDCDNSVTGSQIAGCNGNDPAKSGIDAYPRGPARSAEGLGLFDYAARIEVCRSGYEGGDRCKTYPNGTPKPIGLLQEYGDSERMWFGMFAGTYSKNKGGGDLIKDTGPFSDELNVASDGRFIHVAGLKDASGSVNGTQSSSAFGMANALSLYRVVQYKYSDGTYGTSSNNTNNCTYGLSSFAEGTCQNWGNPFAEAYLNALRYYANLQPAGEFRANDSTYIPGLNVPQNWGTPIAEDNSCAALNIVAFNSSTLSYDGDQLDGPGADVAEVGATTTSAALTDAVGAGEGIHGKTFFVGTTPADGNQTCTSKTIDSLGAVTGTCPEAPRLQGTFKMSGVAWHARINDINSKVSGDQTVETYAVALSSNVPKIEIPVPGSSRSVTLLPACKNLSVSPSVPGGGACAIVDFKVIESHSESEGVGKGTFYVNWEDSEQGGDFDQDMWGLISYQVTGSQIKITTDTLADSTPYLMGFGYILSGTSDGDGFHAHSGIDGYTSPTGVPAECLSCTTANAATTQTYSVGASATGLLEDPLWYAAKWGGFNDTNGTQQPDLQSEWDVEDADGNAVADGVPDNYFFAIEPRQLEASLRRVFDKIVGRVSSGTAAAVVANAREGEGAIYQALYEPVRKDANGNEVTWIGTLHALWVDQNGYLREDDGDAKLEDYTADPAVELYFDATAASEQDQKTKVRRYTGDPADGVFVDGIDIGELSTLWNAREQLAALSDATIDLQRVYSSTATSGRYILTNVDLDQDGAVDSGETLDFVAGSFGTGKFGILNAPDAATATQVINYVRGKDSTTPFLRPRTLDYDGDGEPETLRLGDIVNATPTVVGAPAEAFDLLYNDQTYAAFRDHYRNRRNVVYVGANDGMLHAFNAGFYKADTSEFVETRGTETAHPLGAELWGFIPYHLLPHLTWLSSTEYPHAWYVDAKARAFDARAFNADDDHPSGWGTLLVVGLRMGGGDLELKVKDAPTGFSGFSGFGTSNVNSQTVKTRSSYLVLDVTNPEQPPKLIAELAPSALGFSTSYPTVIAMSKTGNEAANLAAEGWYLVFGSGPSNLDAVASNLIDAKSTATGKLYIWDLKNKAYVPGYAPLDLGNSSTAGAPNSFVGDPVSVDWDLDFKADSVFFGTIGGTASAPEGKLFKLALTDDSGVEQTAPANWAPKVMVNPDNPSVSTPTVTFDELGNKWVFAGTGRLYGDPDKSSAKKQNLFGVIDSTPGTGLKTPMYDYGTFTDVTDARVATTGEVAGLAGAITEADLVTDIGGSGGTGGWKLDLDVGTVAERSVSQMALLGDILFATAYTPSTDLCGGEGSSELYGLYYKTGAPKSSIPTFGTTSATFGTETVSEVIRSVDIGAGLASSPSLHVGGARDQRGLTIFTQTSTGAIVSSAAQVDPSSRSGEIDWREVEE